MALIGALDRVRADDGPRFLVKGGVSIELRLGLRVRATKDVDLVFRGDADEMLDALEEAFEQPYAGFALRRKGEVEHIRDTGSRRLEVQLGFGGRDWQSLQLEIAKPDESREPEAFMKSRTGRLRVTAITTTGSGDDRRTWADRSGPFVRDAEHAQDALFERPAEMKMSSSPHGVVKLRET